MVNADSRNFNLDVLRNLAMFMVVVWHFYVHGMKIANVTSEDVSGNVALINIWLSQWVIWISSACVNLFVIISGYFLIAKPFNWKRIVLLWLEVLFYGAGIALLFYYIWPECVSSKELLSLFFPITGDNYWFFQQYFGLVCLAPFLSLAVNHLSEAHYRRFLLAITLLGSTITFKFPLGTIMYASKGYCLLWFVFLFFWGGYLKRFPIRMKPRNALLSVIAIGVVGCFFVLSKSLVKSTFLFEVPAYNSFGFFISIFLFVFLNNLKPMGGFVAKHISSFAAYLFGVYLIHDHPLIRKWIWYELFDWPSLINSVWLIPIMLVTVVGIFLSCILIDAGRAWLFRVAGVEKLAAWLGNKGESLVGRICGVESQLKE